MSRTVSVWVILLLLCPSLSASARVLESPADGATVSGIGFISGWICGADKKRLTFLLNDGPPRPMASGLPRGDTRHLCRTMNNGFIAQINWNLLGAGTHKIAIKADRSTFAGAWFTVGTTGEEMVRGVHGPFHVPNFPAPGEQGIFVWNESTQHLELAAVWPDPGVTPEPEPEPEPDPGPFFAGTWTLQSSVTANCQPPTQGQGALWVKDTGTVAGWFQQDEHLRYASGTYRANHRYEVAGYITQAGHAEWDVFYRRRLDDDRQLMGTFRGTFRDAHYGSGTWSYPVGCQGTWRATRP